MLLSGAGPEETDPYIVVVGRNGLGGCRAEIKRHAIFSKKIYRFRCLIPIWCFGLKFCVEISRDKWEKWFVLSYHFSRRICDFSAYVVPTSWWPHWPLLPSGRPDCTFQGMPCGVGKFTCFFCWKVGKYLFKLRNWSNGRQRTCHP